MKKELPEQQEPWNYDSIPLQKESLQKAFFAYFLKFDIKSLQLLLILF